MSDVSRRGFLATSAVAGSTLIAPAVHAAGGDTLKVALVGCGGRGTGAALNALKADPSVKLVAVADVFHDLAEKGLKTVRGFLPEKIDVTPERVFSGFDAYKQAIDLADVVILATPPGFRPVHLAYAVEKNKHVFMEKPHAVDAAGAKSVIESAKLAQSKNLGLVSGFCYRYDPFKRETMKRVHGGEIGAVHAVHSQFLTGELWTRASKTNDPREMEYQLRMWYYFTWLSGDFIVEQACHNVDKIAWAMNGKLPIAATGLGGRQVRTDDKFGNIWDHFAVVYEFEDDAKAFLHCRQHNKTQSNTVDTIYGTGGSAQLMKHTTSGKSGKWAHPGMHDFGQMYQQEHDELFASIRAGKPLNDGVASAHSTLMAILGREAAYTGQRVTWNQLMNSKQVLTPANPAFGPHEVPPVARPGVTKFA